MPNTLKVVRPPMETPIPCGSGNLIAQQGLSEAMKPFLSLKLVGASSTKQRPGDDLVFASGQATVTYVLSGQATYADSTGKRGLLKPGGLCWVLSGSGAWSRIQPATDNYLAIELRLALAPALENSPPQSALLDKNWVEREGPARLIIGWFGESKGNFTLPSLMNYAVVNLRARQDWCYGLPANHMFAWVLVVSGRLIINGDEVTANRIVLLDAPRGNIHLHATADTLFVVGSSQAFDHDLIAHQNSVHTSTDALRLAVARLSGLEASIAVNT